MIARIWHGITDPAKSDEYLGFLHKRAVPDYRNTKGNLGVYVMRCSDDEGKSHFFTLSVWESFDAIKRFAGDDYDKARYYPEDKDFLHEFEPYVQHYELG
jgi:heme-degrading monooxygenase HmoA